MVLKNFDPWSLEVITPSESLISKFYKFDKTKSSVTKRRAFNRARKWISDLLKRPFNIPDSDRMRHIDVLMALEDMTNQLAMPGGVTYEKYLKSCLAPPLPIKDQVHIPKTITQDLNHEDNDKQESSENPNDEEASEIFNDEEHFQDAEDKSSTTQNEESNDTSDSKTPLKCEICDQVFSQNRDLQSHISEVHEGKKSYKCKSCAAEFSTQSDLNDHIATAHAASSSTVHEGQKTFQCNVCDSQFAVQSNLKNHMRSAHEGNTTLKLRPICKSIWLNLTCQTEDCDRAHPERCDNPDCFITDQGLSNWRTLQCRKWHSRPKEKKIKTEQPFNFRRPHKKSPRSWKSPMLPPNGQYFRADIPIWQGQGSFQSFGFKSGLSHAQFHPNNQSYLSGNEKAPWMPHLPMGSSPVWGNQHHFVQTVRQALGIINGMPYM